MTGTYCGKKCTDCKEKLERKCSGCKVGPGREFGGTCELAKCCRNKAYKECLECDSRETCMNYRIVDRMPELNAKMDNDAKLRLEAVIKRAPFLGKWIRVLFILVILVNISSLLNNEVVGAYFPILGFVGIVMGMISSIAYGCVLIKLSSAEDRYGVAGACSLIVGVLDAVSLFFLYDEEAWFWPLAIVLVSYVLSIMSTCYECSAHSIVLTGVNRDLAEDWDGLGKAYVLFAVLFLIDAVIMFINSHIAAIIMVLILIGFIGVSIVKIANLYQTANAFKRYAKNN